MAELTAGEEIALRCLGASERQAFVVLVGDGPTIGCAGRVNTRVAIRLQRAGLVHLVAEPTDAGRAVIAEVEARTHAYVAPEVSS